MCAQVFLMGGVYFAYRAFQEDKISPSWLAWASVFWICAIASRTIVAFVLAFFMVLVLIGILRQHGLAWTSRFKALILALALPMIVGAIGLGWYNAVRFGSVFDFGLEYQLTSHNNHKYESDLFSIQYIVPNIYNYLFNPPEKIHPFPYYRIKAGNETEAFGSPIPELYSTERVIGLLYVLPFMFFAFVPALQMAVKRFRHRQNIHEAQQPLDSLVLALSGAILIAIASLLVYYYATMRYYMDVIPMLIVLAIMGFWIGYQAVESDGFVWFVYVSVGILLAGVSLVVPNVLALLSSQRINLNSPQVLPALDAFFKSIFPG
jgi:hypothetical protein